jgi:hypothetical protein
MGVDHGLLDIGVPKDLRQRQDVATLHHTVTGHGVAQSMPAARQRLAALRY